MSRLPGHPADRLLAVPEAAVLGLELPATFRDEPFTLVLPSVEQVEAAPLDTLPAFVGTLVILKAKALARLVGNSQTPALPDEAWDRYMTVPEIAEQLALTAQYVYEAIRTGDLPAIEIGLKKYKRVALADLRAWAASKKLDSPNYVTYSAPRGRRRSAAPAKATRSHPTRTRGPGRRSTEQRGEVGTRRTRDQGVSGTPDATPSEATTAPTWQEEYLTDGVH